MESIMVNSSSVGPERNGNTAASSMQTNGVLSKTSPSPITARCATQSKNDFTEAVTSAVTKTQAVEPTPSQTCADDQRPDHCGCVSQENWESNETKKTLFCSFPLEKVQTILSKYTSLRSDNSKMKIPRKVLCLYCDRTFVNVNLQQKHAERCHSTKQLRRVSLRKHQNFLTSTPCIYCDKFTTAEHTLKDLFKHLIDNHSNKYFGCLHCEIRFLNASHLDDHNALYHNRIVENGETTYNQDALSAPVNSFLATQESETDHSVKSPRKRQKTRKESKMSDTNIKPSSINDESDRSSSMKNLRGKKLSVKSSRMILKRSKRIQAKTNDTKKKRPKDFSEKKKNERVDQAYTSKLNEKSTKITSNLVNPYPEFDHFFQVKKITDHSIDNLKISSLTFDDVFDKAFFNKIKCNIQENLLHHIDGKLFKNEESESRISNFEKNCNIPQEPQNINTENYGCELSLNAIAPTTLLLSNQLGDDPEFLIEYGSKPSKKKTQVKKDEVHYKYFTRRKYQASILEHKENRDLSKLDMWTQYIIRNRQQKIIDDKKSPKEILDYFGGEEYKSMMRREELNRILDRRGPFEDLRQEVSKKAALDKLNGENSTCGDDHFAEIGELLNDILNRVFETAKESSEFSVANSLSMITVDEENVPEIPSYLNLRRCTDVIPENEIDRSDKIALICSSQETENFELPSNTVRGKHEKVELTGEWARSRIYICAACGLKLQNLKQFLEHKSGSHQYIWVQHYEFVGNQSELYRHLTIPVLGKVGVLENTLQCKIWKRSDARLCTKCGKQCNSLGELHRHILECGGDWTWMLARKKCKYRPFGAKSRRKKRGLVKRIFVQKTEPSEKKIYKKSYDLPRQKPSDADTIKRMLANLPAKRATRKMISLKDGFNTSRNRQIKTTKQSKFKCGKLIRGKKKEHTSIVKTEYEKTNNDQTNHYRRSLRCLNKVLTSRILETNSTLMVRRRYSLNIKTEQKRKGNINLNKSQSEVQEKKSLSISSKKVAKSNVNIQTRRADKQGNNEVKLKRCSPRIEKRLDFNTGADKTIKRFFPVKKKKVIHIDSLKNLRSTKLSAVNKNLETDVLPPIKSGIKPSTESDETTQSQTNDTINLRKRKFENNNLQSRVTGKVKKSLRTTTTRILRNNLNKVFDKPNVYPSIDEKSNKQENCTETGIKNVSDNSENTSNKDTISEEQKKDILIQEETISADNALEVDIKQVFEKSVDENTDKLNIQSTSNLRTKKKLRKPVRGLNDCIAMLTNKLNKTSEKLITDNVFNDVLPSQVHSENEQITVNSKSEYILKVPFSDEHFHLRSVEKPTDVSQNSGCELIEKVSYADYKSADNFNKIQSENSCEGEQQQVLSNNELDDQLKKYGEEVLDIRVRNLNQNENTVEIQNTLFKKTKESFSTVLTAEELNCLNQITTVSEQSDNRVSLDTDSEDEIPLAKFLREEDCNQTIYPTNTNINIFSEIENTALQTFNSSTSCTENINENSIITNDSASQEINEEEDIDMILGHVKTIIHEKDIQVDESSNIFEEPVINKNSPVIMEIKDHFYENVNAINTILENSSAHIDNASPRIVENKLNKSEIISLDLSLENEDDGKVDHLSVSKDVNDLVSSEKNSEKFSLLTKNNLEYGTWKDAENDISLEVASIKEISVENEKLLTATCEYKENSLLLLEDSVNKHKPRKKNYSNKLFMKNKWLNVQNISDAKENSDLLGNNDTKKVSRTAKSKALESIFDDVLLELSKNELLPQDSVKRFMDEVVDSSSDKFETCSTSEKEVNRTDSIMIEDAQTNTDGIATDTFMMNNTNTAEDKHLIELSENQMYSDDIFQNVQPESNENLKNNIDTAKELRRSLRNSRRITSYNETDLIDPLLDDLDSDKTISKIIKETAKGMFSSKRKSRKLVAQKKLAKNVQDDKNVDGEELFDLLKAVPNENIALSKPINTLFNTFDEISNDFSDEKFNVLDDILEKSIAVIEENLSEKVTVVAEENSSEKAISNPSEDYEKVPNLITENCGLSDDKVDSMQSDIKTTSKKRIKKHKSKTKQPKVLKNTHSKDSENISDNNSECTNDMATETQQNTVLKGIETEKNKVIYCEICNKFFCRMESLTKHKRTLTHISKLSELEAKEAALKSKRENVETLPILTDSRKDLNLLEILDTMDDNECKQCSSFTVSVDNSNLKLADIINDVLNKPLLSKEEDTQNISKGLVQTETSSHLEIRRCKSLAERKSFDSENCLITPKNSSHEDSHRDYFDSNGAAGTILEKQITLLENIIENRSSAGYVDGISDSSSQSLNEDANPETETNVEKRINSDSTYPDLRHKEDNINSTIEKSFLRPSQYEEISEDSNLRNYEEQKSRKALNRDEELFLECCSLLKSGSEMSTYSKKSNNLLKDLNNLELKACDESDWLENNYLSQKENSNFVECYSENSNMRTPLEDSFSQENSNSVSISSNWEISSSSPLLKKEHWREDLTLKKENLTFQEAFGNKTDQIFSQETKFGELHTEVSSLERVISEVLRSDLTASEESIKKRFTDSGDISRDWKKAATLERKKMLTKGAMKVFEGLKVSIPTEELNIDKLLISVVPSKSTIFKEVDLEHVPNHENNITTKSIKRNLQRKSNCKGRSSNFNRQKDLQLNDKTHDVYDFEETQDNSYIFTRPNFRSFKSNYEKPRRPEKLEGSDNDSQDCMDAFNVDALSSSTSSISEASPTKFRTQQNITKKKCMIMGRIFKNAVKSRVADEDIRNIPVIDNTKLVGDFVLSCPEPATNTVDKKMRMTEEELNLAFDKLINNKTNEPQQILDKTWSTSQMQYKTCFNKRKSKMKNKKRSHGNSESSDDEFKLKKYCKKRPKKRNNTEESCINLEQELRECIGVASRKSQRKCTSGKQNVLMEYWSSDESSFEALLERQITESVRSNHTSNDISNNNASQDLVLEKNDLNLNESTNNKDICEVVNTDFSQKKAKVSSLTCNVNRRKRHAANPLYHWSSSSEDESHDLIEIRPIRDEIEDDEERPVQHGWIVGDSPKKLVTMLAQAKGKKCDVDSVKECGRKRTNMFS